MDFIIDAIVEWLKGLLVDGIMGNLDGLFDNVNQSVGEIATQVGTTPADWNAGVFSMIRQISETAILPIAGVILTFVMTYELIQMLIERNNLHEVDTWMFFKWVFKTFVAVMILTNTFNMSVLQEAPFTDYGSIVEVFTDLSVWAGIRQAIERVNANALAA